MAPTVDERGRVVLPEELREAHGLTPGRPVLIESTDEGVVIRPALPKDEAFRRLTGGINQETRKPGATPEDPLAAKRMWEPTP